MRKMTMGMICLAMMLLVLGGCGGVESERRAFPLIMSVDSKDDVYLVSYGMANLPAQTEQGKSDEETKTGLVKVYEGESLDAITKEYNRGQEYYLDLGHVKTMIFGEAILENPEMLKKILTDLESNPIVGDDVYVFSAQDPQEIMNLNGAAVESLSEYLVGIYKNRPVSQEKKMVTLKDVYYAWHNEDRIRSMPKVVLDGETPTIPSLYD